jgi:alkyldihydroxyacetonephosphate synthase
MHQAEATPAPMKWWGWGDDNVSFTHEGKPELAPFIERVLGLDVRRPGTPAIAFEELEIPPPELPAGLKARLQAAVGAEHVSTDDHDRVVHARGKSLTDLVRQRRGDLGRLPDAVVRPADEDQVIALMRAALAADAVVIPFGGGSSISGSLEAEPGETRAVISVDMARMNRVLSLDATSQLARVQTGVFGPDLERQLNAQGWTCGHFPDSFTYSTLGGWIATRSSGMQSDRYGDVAELTRGLRVVTPSGVLAVRPVPSTSTGPSVREMVLGSEGRLGIITEATIHVRRVPPERKILGYLFPGWAAGLAAMRDIAAGEAEPSVTRVSDSYETAFSFATRTDPTPLDRVKSKALQAFLKRKGWDLEAMCLSFIGYEGSADHVAAQRKLTERIVKRHGGLCIGTSPGELYDQKKFDTPYIRDFLLDRGAPGDVSETSAPWGELQTVYDNVMAAGHGAFHQLGVRGYLMCHLSHSYHAGACLYFTFALNPPAGRDALEDYGVVKRAIQQAFVDSGATLSHHHAVGTEHAQWLEEDISAPGVAMLRALFEGTDPGANLNPGKIVATDRDRPSGETVARGERSRTNGGTGGPRRSLDAQRASQPRT